MLSGREACMKRSFDVILAVCVLGMFWWLILLAWLIASLETRGNGMFVQTRVGRGGVPFRLLKIKTMTDADADASTVTVAGDRRITRSGRFFRRTKIDELPQLINILLGEMSFVGPRPDVPGYADRLEGEARELLSVRPGLTGPATLKYRDEERMLADAEDPKTYNDTVIWPDKVRMNLDYVTHWSFGKDLYYLYKTVAG